MTNIDALTRKVRQIDGQIPAPAGPLTLQGEFDFSLFSEAEQAQLQAFLGTIEHYLEGCTIIPEILARLTNEELDELERWVKLRDTRTAERAR